jgi:multiple sugar transport system ATP-binding protein
MNLVARGDELVGFRPEHLLPADLPAGPDRLEMTIAVERVERLSGDRHVLGTALGVGDPTPVIARLPATVDTEITAGGEHRFAVDRPRVRMFDAASGLAAGR